MPSTSIAGWKGYAPDHPVPISMDSPRFPPGQARKLDEQRWAARETAAKDRNRASPNVRRAFRIDPTPASSTRDKASSLDGRFACVGGNLGLAGGGCFGDGDAYLYTGLAWPPGMDVEVGHAPGGVAGYLKGWSGSATGLPGAGIGFSDGKPSSNAWTVGTPGVSATYGMSIGDIADRFRAAGEDISEGVYNMLGRPYDDPRER